MRWSGGGSFRKARIWGCAESLVTNPYCAIRTRCEGNVRVPTLADGAEPRAIQASRVKDEERVTVAMLDPIGQAENIGLKKSFDLPEPAR